jgi:hypothetical protein
MQGFKPDQEGRQYNLFPYVQRLYDRQEDHISLSDTNLEDACDTSVNITSETLDKAITKLSSGKATGIDGLKDIHLKQMSQETREKLLATFNGWLQSG